MSAVAGRGAREALAAAPEFSLWGELRGLVLENAVWLLLSSGALVLATLLQTQHLGRLTAELTVKVLKFDAASPGSAERRKELLATLWRMCYCQGAVQMLQFAGGAGGRIISRRITRGLQLRMYAELLRRDVVLFDRHKTGELLKCVEERVIKLADLVQAVCRGLPSVVGVPLTLRSMWRTSPALAWANGGMITATVAALFAVYVVGVKQLSKRIAKAKGVATSAITESFFAVRTVHGFGAQDFLARRYRELLGSFAWLETAQQLAFQGLHQTLHSLQLLITVTTYMSGTRILAEQQQNLATAAATVAGAADAAPLEAESLALFQELCSNLFRGMFGLAGMGNAYGTAAGGISRVE